MAGSNPWQRPNNPGQPPDAAGEPGTDRLTEAVTAMMDAAWRAPGFCLPNQETYPHQWLWDSCFHAIVWSALGSDRGGIEVANALANQSADGFVPHMNYWLTPDLHAEFWGRQNASSITQPPMYGHAIAIMVKAGQEIPVAVIDRAADGLAHLGYRKRTETGLIPVYHPWETGCDDSARWDSWLHGQSSDRGGGSTDDERRRRWKERKGQLVAALRLSPDGHAIGSDEFQVGSVGFNALVAFNAAELADVAPHRADELRVLAGQVSAAVRGRWDGRGWPDDGPESGRVRTLYSMLALLVDPQPDGFDALVSPQEFGAPFGPRGVSLSEPSYDPATYWRGPAWPQLSYLAIVAAERAGREADADTMANWLVDGALQSGLAEYWHPESGEGLGARPQTWAGLAVIAAR